MSENIPPRSPRKRHGLRPSLSGVFQPGFSLTDEMQRVRLSEPSEAASSSAAAASSSSSSNIRAVGVKGSWSTLRGWPNWGSLRMSREQVSTPLAFTIAMHDRILDYSSQFAVEATRLAFEDAVNLISTNRETINSLAMNGNSAVFDVELAEEMAQVIFGSNLIERVGCGLKETVNLCKELFLEERTDLETIPPRSPEYAAKLEEMICRNKKDKHILRSRREVVNHAAAFIHITKAVVTEDRAISETLIKETHSILCRDIDIPETNTAATEYAGVYRRIPVQAGNTQFVPPHLVPKAMKTFVATLNQDIQEAENQQAMDPFYIAAKACDAFVNIHPFRDGNGRLCRLILNTILLKYAGIVAPIGEHDEERAEYLAICKRRSEEETGPGELAVLTLRKCVQSLRDFGGRLRKKGNLESAEQ